MILTLPFPPSTNALWRSVKGRAIKSKAYREWEKLAGQALSLQRDEPDKTGKVSLFLAFSRPDKRARGLDNYLKATIDLLVTHRVIPDDENSLESLVAKWDESRPPGTVTVIVSGP